MMKAFFSFLFLLLASIAANAVASFQTEAEADREGSDAKIAKIAAANANANTNAGTNANAEEARWLVKSGSWGVLSYTEMKEHQGSNFKESNFNLLDSNDEKVSNLRSAAVSFADANGNIFFYLMGKQSSKALTLTLSEASLEPTSNFKGAACGEKGTTDPEDPRCAKLSIQGSLSPCQDKLTCQIGKKALFDRHPEMKNWPEDHHFTVHELDIHDVWMISNYGGGGTIPVTDYHAASPKHHPNLYSLPIEDVKSFGTMSTVVNDKIPNKFPDKVPDWDKKVERARWIVAKSLWTTGTLSFL